jgi:5'/3'-nucleotidase SurE
MNILVTNDDGYDSPLLQVLVELLSKQSWVRHIDVVVPATEQSWIGSAVNKRGVKNIREKTIHGHTYHIVNGSPADCTSLACSGLFEYTPDIVFSGINFGVNAGVCFYLSSGTVAGARQASLFNIPGISCSTALPREIFSLWSVRDFEKLDLLSEYFRDIAQVHVSIADTLLKKNVFSKDCRERVDFVSINTPEKISDNKPTITILEPTRFKPIFRKLSDNRFEHMFDGFVERETVKETTENDLITDVQALREGKNSVTMFNVNQQGELSAGLDF